MPTRIAQDSDIDDATSRSVGRAIGERLRENFGPERSELPSAMQGMLDEMRRRESLKPGETA